MYSMDFLNLNELCGEKATMAGCASELFVYDL